MDVTLVSGYAMQEQISPMNPLGHVKFKKIENGQKSTWAIFCILPMIYSALTLFNSFNNVCVILLLHWLQAFCHSQCTNGFFACSLYFFINGYTTLNLWLHVEWYWFLCSLWWLVSTKWAGRTFQATAGFQDSDIFESQ